MNDLWNILCSLLPIIILGAILFTLIAALPVYLIHKGLEYKKLIRSTKEKL